MKLLRTALMSVLPFLASATTALAVASNVSLRSGDAPATTAPSADGGTGGGRQSFAGAALSSGSDIVVNPGGGAQPQPFPSAQGYALGDSHPNCTVLDHSGQSHDFDVAPGGGIVVHHGARVTVCGWNGSDWTCQEYGLLEYLLYLLIGILL